MKLDWDTSTALNLTGHVYNNLLRRTTITFAPYGDIELLFFYEDAYDCALSPTRLVSAFCEPK